MHPLTIVGYLSLLGLTAALAATASGVQVHHRGPTELFSAFEGRWRLVTLDGRLVRGGDRVRLDVRGRAVSGEDGCNSFSAQRRGDRIVNVETTLRACADPDAQSQAAHIGKVIESGRLSLLKGRLHMVGPAGVLVFDRASEQRGAAGQGQQAAL